MQNEPLTREATEFNGKRVLVTSGTKGIGEAIVKRLVRGGASPPAARPNGSSRRTSVYAREWIRSSRQRSIVSAHLTF